MNIFVLDKNIEKCVKFHNDKHCVKMILETTQLLCTAHHVLNSQLDYMYKKTHVNHPCAVWCRKCIENYKWLVEFGISLCKEYTFRYNKIHKCHKHLIRLKYHLPKIESNGEITTFALAMPDYCKLFKKSGKPDVVASYRNYYILEKQKIAQWKKREIPYWFKK